MNRDQKNEIIRQLAKQYDISDHIEDRLDTASYEASEEPGSGWDDYDESDAFDDLVDLYFDNPGHLNSKELTGYKEIMIAIGMVKPVDISKVWVSSGKRYWFKHKGIHYEFADEYRQTQKKESSMQNTHSNEEEQKAYIQGRDGMPPRVSWGRDSAIRKAWDKGRNEYEKAQRKIESMIDAVLKAKTIMRGSTVRHKREPNELWRVIQVMPNDELGIRNLSTGEKMVVKVSDVIKESSDDSIQSFLDWIDDSGVSYIKNSGGSYDIEGSLDLRFFEPLLTSFPITFGTVEGYFNCSGQKLTSLKGAPRIVKGYFDCSDNQLTSLVGGPQSVEGSYVCVRNQLTSLKGAPKEVVHFDCSLNQLTNFEYAPKTPKGKFFAYRNPGYKGSESPWLRSDYKHHDRKESSDDKKSSQLSLRIFFNEVPWLKDLPEDEAIEAFEKNVADVITYLQDKDESFEASVRDYNTDTDGGIIAAMRVITPGYPSIDELIKMFEEPAKGRQDFPPFPDDVQDEAANRGKKSDTFTITINVDELLGKYIDDDEMLEQEFKAHVARVAAGNPKEPIDEPPWTVGPISFEGERGGLLATFDVTVPRIGNTPVFEYDIINAFMEY